MAVFQSNYFSFLNQIASTAAVTLNDILVLSVSSGSVLVSMQVNSNSDPGSSAS